MVCEKRTMNDWNQFSLKMPLTKSYWNSFHSALLNLQQFCCKIRLNRTYFRSISKQASNKHTLPLITLLHWAHFISFYSISHLCSQFFMSTERRDEQNEIFKCWNCVWKKANCITLHCIALLLLFFPCVPNVLLRDGQFMLLSSANSSEQMAHKHQHRVYMCHEM